VVFYVLRLGCLFIGLLGRCLSRPTDTGESIRISNISGKISDKKRIYSDKCLSHCPSVHHKTHMDCNRIDSEPSWWVMCYLYRIFSLMQQSLLSTKTIFSLLKYTNEIKGALICLRLLIGLILPPCVVYWTNADEYRCLLDNLWSLLPYFVCSQRTVNGVVVDVRRYVKGVIFFRKK
jgi:hypothetical protein